MRTDRIIGIAGLLALTIGAFAQQPARPSFEVASVKPGDPDDRRVRIGIQPGGRFITANASLEMMLGFAYDLRNHQISGGPNWLDSAKFNVEARAPATVVIPPGPEGASQFRLMLQSLLAERFKLVVHRESPEQQVYNLVTDKGGLKMKANVTPGKMQGLSMEGRGDVAGMAAPVPLLANFLSQQLGRSVIDKTGLAGRYDFTLKWMPDPGPGAPAQPGDDAAPPPDNSGPSIFTALQNDLGLKLQSAKGPVEILVIDSVEKPDAN
jgi:uncharacterized protein (TIGR03435 family)